MRFKRSQRLQELILQEISLLIQNGLKDPRIGFCTVTKIELTDNLRHAKVLISVIGKEKEIKDTLEGLASAKNFIRKTLGKNLYLKYVPELEFKKDGSPEQLDKINRLINEIHYGRNS
ncbi:MAG: 30S ribosome-binding factor RbfA [Nitrospinota bacterium]|nr:30S ribosome-binding factor RbfA [Nitrospinota bacterium]